jgi:thioredoxin 1
MKNLEEYIYGSQPVLVEFYATWSESCNQMDAVLQDVRATAGERAIVLKIDIEEYSEWIKQYSINKIPTLVIFKDGQIIWRKSGIVAAHEILEHLSTVMV